MKGAIISVKGNWAHFKKPETNNNPLTHDFITKTAFVGLIGAVLGIERAEMLPMFPQLTEDFGYGVEIVRAVKKESWSFKMRYATNLFEKRPVQMEFLKCPSFKVALALINPRSEKVFDDFVEAVGNSEAHFTPVLGLHNCPAEIELKVKGEFSEVAEGKFSTNAFITSDNHKITDLPEIEDFRVGFEKIPTYQKDFWSQHYKTVVYPSEGRNLIATGKYFRFSDDSNWVLI